MPPAMTGCKWDVNVNVNVNLHICELALNYFDVTQALTKKSLT